MKYNLAYSTGALYHTETTLYIKTIKDFKAYLGKKEEIPFTVIPTNSENSKKKIKGELFLGDS